MFDDVLCLSFSHCLADVAPNWDPKCLLKVVQILMNKVGENDSKNDRNWPEKRGPKRVPKLEKSL